MEIEYEMDDAGHKVLSGRTFEKEQFYDLELPPDHRTPTRIEHCKFMNCSTSPGTSIIGAEVTLNDVVFHNFACGDAIYINAAAELKEVVISGRKPSRVFVQPGTIVSLPADLDGFVMSEPQDTEFQLDISAFRGHVKIVGIRSRMVRKDPMRHVSVHAKWKDEIDWDGLDIQSTYWKSFFFSVSELTEGEGVFSLPKKNQSGYEDAIRDKERLEKAGLCFE
jgi:hypothetical protein